MTHLSRRQFLKSTIIAARDKRYDRVCDLLCSLKREFPRNPLYGRELERFSQLTAKPAEQRPRLRMLEPG